MACVNRDVIPRVHMMQKMIMQTHGRLQFDNRLRVEKQWTRPGT